VIKVYIDSNDEPDVTKYLIQKDEDSGVNDWVEITLDKKKQIFVARKVVGIPSDTNWIPHKDYIFPSSLFNVFLRREG